ncbi:hypothetical protein [Lacrimispora amygdalina]|uniref:hypothetical protein n=1 Tax=Lacrimispora amygdalina TaxID=253257 RepID=UPI000BE2AD9C|nr:hypothetical protein [Lacrimispora amygdalina]
MLNYDLLLTFSNLFTNETFLFLKYYVVYEEKYQKAKVISKCRNFENMPEWVKASLSISIRCCSARLFEMDNICKKQFGSSLILRRSNQEAYTLSELRELICSAVDILSQKKSSFRVRA